MEFKLWSHCIVNTYIHSWNNVALKEAFIVESGVSSRTDGVKLAFEWVASER
jgi:hypothetical protein